MWLSRRFFQIAVRIHPEELRCGFRMNDQPGWWWWFSGGKQTDKHGLFFSRGVPGEVFVVGVLGVLGVVVKQARKKVNWSKGTRPLLYRFKPFHWRVPTDLARFVSSNEQLVGSVEIRWFHRLVSPWWICRSVRSFRFKQKDGHFRNLGKKRWKDDLQVILKVGCIS